MSGPGAEDFRDDSIVDALELGSDGTTIIFSGATVVSTASGSQLVILSGVDLFRSEQLENGDIITLSGTSGADGNYTVNAVVDIDRFSVNEAILSSSGGLCTARYAAGAGKVGFDSTGLTTVTANNVQDAIAELDTASAGDDPDSLFNEINEDSFDEIIYAGRKISSIITWASSAKLLKIRELVMTYSRRKVSTITEIQYDGAGVEVERNVETLQYSGKLRSIDRVHT